MTTHDDTTQAAATAIPLPPRGLITAVIHASATSLPAVELDYGIWVLLPGTIQPGVAALAELIGLEAALAYRGQRQQRLVIRAGLPPGSRRRALRVTVTFAAPLAPLVRYSDARFWSNCRTPWPAAIFAGRFPKRPAFNQFVERLLACGAERVAVATALDATARRDALPRGVLIVRLPEDAAAQERVRTLAQAEVAQHGMAVEDEGRVLRWRWGARTPEGRGDDVAA